jgi:hypothetical protein
MNNFRQQYEECKSIYANLEDEARNILFTKYIELNLKGDSKRINIDSTDQESILNKRVVTLPGMIYTFIYKEGLNIEKYKDKNISYIDYIPIVFCINNGKNYFNGINFNLLPEKERLHFLDYYYDIYKDFFSNIENYTQNDILRINTNFINYIKSGNNTSTFLKIFNHKYNVNFEYAFRKYTYKNIISLRMIEYEEWKYILFYKPTEAFKLVNEKIIQELFYNFKEKQ